MKHAAEYPKGAIFGGVLMIGLLISSACSPEDPNDSEDSASDSSSSEDEKTDDEESTSSEKSDSENDEEHDDDSKTSEHEDDATSSNTKDSGDSNNDDDDSEDKDPSTSSDDSSSTDDTDDSSDPGGECMAIQFDADWLKLKVSELTGAVDTTLAGEVVRLGERATTMGRQRGRSWIQEQYQALGYEVALHEYAGGANVVASKAGQSDEFYIISAHLDTVQNCPGADDDASGIITNLAMATALADCDLEFSLRFVAFDQEEVGLVGSKAYAKSIESAGEAEKLRGDLQVEMTAYDSNSDGLYNLIECDDPMNQALATAVEDAIQMQGLALIGERACTERSDHASFWNIGRPAIVVSEIFFGDNADATPCYHQSCDTVDKLNFEYMNQLTRALTFAAQSLLGAQ